MMVYARIRSGATSCDTTKARFDEDIERSPVQKDGFLPLVNGNTKPAQPDEYILYHIEVQGDTLVKTYSPGEMPPEPKAPRVFSKIYLHLALERRGLYEQFCAVLDEAGLASKWADANELSEAFPKFSDYVAQAKTALKLTDAEVEAILAEAVAR